MKISVRVKPGAKNEGVTKIDDSHYVVCVKAPPVEGKANEAAIRILSEYLGIPKSSIRILKGEASKNKIVEILQPLD